KKEHAGRAKKAKLMGDGLPRYLTGDKFYHQVAENEKRQQAEAIAIWRQAESSRIKRNNAHRQAHQEALAAWNGEKDQAKAEGRRVGQKKPVLRKLEGPLPRP
ncbi:hypothetical protein EV363DRAFT_1120117, partial [Boletus edulis]